MLKVKIYHTLENARLKKGWNEIYAKNNYCLQNSFDWIYIWWKHFKGYNRKLFIITVENGGSICGIGPFMSEENYALNQLKFIGTGLTDFHEILLDPDYKSDVIPIILKYILKLKKHDLINFEEVPDNSDLYSYFIEQGNFKFRKMSTCLTIDLDYTSWEEYKKDLSYKFRNEWTRKFNKLSRQGKVEFSCRSPENIRTESVQKILSLAQENYEKTGRFEKMLQKNIRDFFIDFIQKISGVRIYTLDYNNKLISYMIGFFQNNIFYTWNSAFNREFHSFSPGVLLRGLIIKDLIQKGVKEMNFMRGDYLYKRSWMIGKKIITNYQFLHDLSSFKGYLGLKYYLNWKWAIKTNFSNILSKPIIHNLLVKMKHRSVKS